MSDTIDREMHNDPSAELARTSSMRSGFDYITIADLADTPLFADAVCTAIGETTELNEVDEQVYAEQLEANAIRLNALIGHVGRIEESGGIQSGASVIALNEATSTVFYYFAILGAIRYATHYANRCGSNETRLSNDTPEGA